IPGLLATAFGPWLKQIKTRITEIEKIGIEAKTAGVVIENLPKKSSLDSAATILPKMAAIEQKIADAEAKAKEPSPAPAPAAKGFFNPTDTYSLAFFKTMMKHGFDPGVTWGPGWTDAMHFDYVQGFHQIVDYACGPGKKN